MKEAIVQFLSVGSLAGWFLVWLSIRIQGQLVLTFDNRPWLRTIEEWVEPLLMLGTVAVAVTVFSKRWRQRVG